MIKRYEEKNEGSVIGDPNEAANALIEKFSNLQEYKQKQQKMPKPEDENFSSVDDAASFVIGRQNEDWFADFWRENIDLEAKKETIKILLDMGREDVIKQIDKLSDVSRFMDEETLKRIRGDKEKE